jgi:hypothetical protein
MNFGPSVENQLSSMTKNELSLSVKKKKWAAEKKRVHTKAF